MKSAGSLSIPRLQSLESAAFAAWPSEFEAGFKGWRLRLDSGYTKRANSANATAAAEPLTDADIDAIEERFRQRGLQPIFRLPSFTPVGATDALLARRGYRHVEPSFVMVRPGLTAGHVVPASAALNADAGPWPTDAASWLQAFQAVTGASAADEAAHLRILKRIAHPCAWAVHRAADEPLSCGLGVLVDGHLGLFDVATHGDHRRRGWGQALCEQVIGWGARRGAHTAFLQVTASNETAIRLYERLGFEVAYGYGYRIGEHR